MSTYPILYGQMPEALARQLDALYEARPFFSVIIVTDTRVAEVQAEALERLQQWLGQRYPEGSLHIKTHAMLPGEAGKVLTELERLWTEMAALALGRGDLLLAFGGGVVGDLAGMAAATYLRGIRWIQMPTTLLAQVDSSIGGKVAINRPEGKNLVGAFYMPDAVVIDIQLLETLDHRQRASGMAEIIKMALLFDAGLFELLEERGGLLADPLVIDGQLQGIISRAVSLKEKVVQADFREQDQRMLLNFGHTFGHALEYALPEAYIHGEAVALGMLWALAVALPGLHETGEAPGVGSMDLQARWLLIRRLEVLLKRYCLPIRIKPGAPAWPHFFTYMAQDKKRQAHHWTLIGLEALGRGIQVKRLPEDLLEQARSGSWDWLLESSEIETRV